jgi:hypothetical protein
MFFTKPNPNLNPKPGFFEKISNPEPEPKLGIGFLKTRNPNPNSM